MINNKIKYLSVLSALLLVYSNVSFTMDNEPLDIGINILSNDDYTQNKQLLEKKRERAPEYNAEEIQQDHSSNKRKKISPKYNTKETDECDIDSTSSDSNKKSNNVNKNKFIINEEKTHTNLFNEIKEEEKQDIQPYTINNAQQYNKKIHTVYDHRMERVKQRLLNNQNIEKIYDNELWNLKNIRTKMQNAHKTYISKGYDKILEQVKNVSNIITKFGNHLQDSIKYSRNNEMEELLDIVQMISNKIQEYITIVNRDNFNNKTFNNIKLDLLDEINTIIQENFNNIKEFIKEQEEKLSVIEYKIKDTNGNIILDPYDCEKKLTDEKREKVDSYYKKMNPEDRTQLGKLHMKYASVVSNFMRTYYNYNAQDDTLHANESYDNTSDVDMEDVYIESNLNVGEIDKTYNGTKYYEESKRKINNYGKNNLEQVINIAKQQLGYSNSDKLSNKDMMKCLLLIAQRSGTQVYKNILQSILNITDESKLSMLQKTFDKDLITKLIEPLDNKIVEYSINRLNDVLIKLSGDYYIRQKTTARISNNAKQIIESYKSLVETGNNLINELNILQNTLNTLFYAISETNSTNWNNNMEIE